MKGVILAGGKGTRLHPLTKVTNKHLLPVGREPMIFNPINRMIEVGIKEILIITSTEHMGDIVNLLGSGIEFGVEFTYKVQEEPKGIAHALSMAETFASGDRIFVILGDNITTTNLNQFVLKFKAQTNGAKVLITRVDDPSRYGIAAIDEHNIINIEEKPNKPCSDFAVIGYYMYDDAVFDIIRNIRPSERGEYEITSVNNEYIRQNKLTYDILDGFWTDAGTFDSYIYANKELMFVDKK